MRSRDARPNDVPGIPSPRVELDDIRHALEDLAGPEVELVNIAGRWLARWLRSIFH